MPYPAAPLFPWAAREPRPVAARKVRGGFEAAGNADLQHAHTGLTQQLPGFFQAQAQVEGTGRFVQVQFEQPLQLSTGDTDGFCQRQRAERRLGVLTP